MAEQGVETPVSSLRALVPRSTEILALIGDQDFWAKTPMPYEESLLAGFAAIVEKCELGRITADDFTNTVLLGKWILSIEPKYPDREVLLKPRVKTDLRQRLQGLSGGDVDPSINRTNLLLGFYRSELVYLYRGGLIAKDVDVINSNTGAKLGPTKRLELLENQIKRRIDRTQ